MTRMAAFWSLAILLIYGCMSLHTQLGVSFGETATNSLVPGLKKIPLLGVIPNISFFVTAAVALGGLWLINRWLNRAKNADLLIDTEQELRKVTWPTMEETINGSILVMSCVLFLMAFLAGTDYVLAVVVRRVLLGH